MRTFLGPARIREHCATNSRPRGLLDANCAARHRENAPPERAPQVRAHCAALAGWGALGSYQAGAYQALTEAELHPDWIAGISIGAVNAALIAGNPAEKRVEKLREFWEKVSTAPLGLPVFEGVDIRNQYTHRLLNQFQSLGTFSQARQDSFSRGFRPLLSLSKESIP